MLRMKECLCIVGIGEQNSFAVCSCKVAVLSGNRDQKRQGILYIYSSNCKEVTGEPHLPVRM